MTLRRLRVLLLIFAALFLLVEARLVHLQFATRGFWEAEARASRLGGRPVPFSRGGIYDRYGRPLAEGETVHRLSFVFNTFRRETPVGLVLGADRLLHEDLGRDRAGGATIRRILTDPAPFVRAALEISPSQLEGVTARLRGDVEFYARGLLGLDPRGFRETRLSRDEDAPFHSYVDGAVKRAVERIAVQRQSLFDLAGAIEMEPDAFIDLLDQEVLDLDAAVVRAVESNPTPLSARQVRAVRRDLERRDRWIERSVPYRAVFLVNLVPERFGGFEIRDVHRRSYPEESQDVATTLLGWVGYPSESGLERAEEDALLYQELKSRPPEQIDVETAERIASLEARIRYGNYHSDEEQGRVGLEALLEPVVRGRRGWRLVERDSAKNATRLLELTPPVDGKDVVLSLDVELQRACERVLDARVEKGAIVMLDVRDGAIRVMATAPEPTRNEIRRDYGGLLRDERRPLYPRAYRPPGNPPPPGSVFKIVSAAAGLESGAIDAQTTYTCERYLQVGRTRLKCLGHHGAIGVAEALEKSCNIFFDKMSRDVDLDAILTMADKFGFGRATGFGSPETIGLPFGGASVGELPCPFQRNGRGVTFTMRTAIGHAAVDDVTPLQVAASMAVIANGGFRVTPWLVDRIGGVDVEKARPVEIGLRPETLRLIKSGMIAAAETGTARPRDEFDLRPFAVAAKTGTPQAAGEEDHAWIAGFLPHHSPRLAFAVFLENVGVGGGAAGTPIVAEILEQPEFQAFFDGGLR